MSDPIIGHLTAADLDEAFRLSTVVGWNQRLDDWRMLLRLAPAGAFAARLEQPVACIAGTAIAIDYGGFGWIAMMLVDPACRRRGVGRRLLEAAMRAVRSSIPIRLDATPMGRSLYQQYGFEDEAALSRCLADRRRAPLRTRASTEPRPMTDDDLAIVVEQDRHTFGGTRGAVLEWEFRSAPQYAFVVPRSGGSIDYCLGRQGRVFDQIGPIVAGDDETAHALVSAALAAAARDRPVAVDAFDAHAAFARALGDDGFVVERPFVRMRRRPTAGVFRSGTDTQVHPGEMRAMDSDQTRSGRPVCRPERVQEDVTAVPGDGRVPREFAILGPEFA